MGAAEVSRTNQVPFGGVVPVTSLEREVVYIHDPASPEEGPWRGDVLQASQNTLLVSVTERRAARLDGRSAVVTMPERSGALTWEASCLVVRAHPTVVLRLEPLGNAVAVQRRRFFRVRCDIAAKASWESPDPTSTEARVIDLSAGGARLAGICVDAGTKLRLQIYLEDGPLEVDAISVGTTAPSCTRVCFVDVPDAVVDRITRKVFAIEREARRPSWRAL